MIGVSTEVIDGGQTIIDGGTSESIIDGGIIGGEIVDGGIIDVTGGQGVDVTGGQVVEVGGGQVIENVQPNQDYTLPQVGSEPIQRKGVGSNLDGGFFLIQRSPYIQN